MTRAISRYPGSVPVASFINYDDAVAGKKTEFMVVGKQIDSSVSVTFWDGKSEIAAIVGQRRIHVTSPYNVCQGGCISIDPTEPERAEAR